MLAVEDAIDGLKWAEALGGLSALQSRVSANMAALTEWVEDSPNFSFLAVTTETRSPTSVCLKITAPWFLALSETGQTAAAKALVVRLEEAGVAYDIGSYRDAPPGLRIWGGATVETDDLVLLLPWLDWALASVAADYVVAK